MEWGIFQVYVQGELKEVHVAPCDSEGNLEEHHNLLGFCCSPKIEEYRNVLIYTHNQIQ